MKAIVQDVYGNADVLRLADVDPPTPGPKDVLVRVHAAGVDRGAWHAMTGLPLIARAGFGPRRPRNPTPGMDLAGVVEAVGAEAGDLKVGDEVFGSGTSTWAEYALARPGKLARKPAHLSFEQAAALPTSACTARRMIGDAADGGQTLIIGAGGGVGSFAVLLATARGDRVTGVCSTGKVAAVRSIGADQVIDYTREPLTGRYELIVDVAGNRSLRELRALLTPRGRLMLAGGEDGGRWLGGMERSLRLFALAPFVKQRLGAPIVLTRRDVLETLTGVTPLIGEVHPLAEAPTAMARLAAGQITGKAVLTVDHS
ncbi:NAD(P)-dependent alcohol dehydrogenase [Actinoplanes sp. L3-i22]|uniref:NAD(P)-dependent alcohol dehydrogenase n=1 Tax=Actinoplanes sp. L3-i22 TaxID=2836373 RepID=UPI001C7510FA|nr:NAD(P)-dependent alcohol dehydrogenase [Actinoplanes sp. L3-i22]BCY11786.1 NADPH:quinone reductase [Actinoplanes sp. L3-i22]